MLFVDCICCYTGEEEASGSDGIAQTEYLSESEVNSLQQEFHERLLPDDEPEFAKIVNLLQSGKSKEQHFEGYVSIDNDAHPIRDRNDPISYFFAESFASILHRKWIAAAPKSRGTKNVGSDSISTNQ